MVQRDGAWRFEAPGFSVDVSRYPFASAPKVGTATLGIRPEHIGVGDAPRERHAATGKVTIVEPMGGEAVLWTSLAGKPATIKVAGDSEVRLATTYGFTSTWRERLYSKARPANASRPAISFSSLGAKSDRVQDYCSSRRDDG